MSRLTYLLDEVCAGLEIYFSGRTGGQYYKSAFVLCDDYVELCSKLYLLSQSAAWSDTKGGGRFKNFHDVTTEVLTSYQSSYGPSPDMAALIKRLQERRKTRNEFFHGTRLLELNVSHRICVEAFNDLLDYGSALFDPAWEVESRGVRNLETLALLIRLENRCFSDPHLLAPLSDLVATWPRNVRTSSARGVQIAVHPEDLHLRLCVINGAGEFRDRLQALLSS